MTGMADDKSQHSRAAHEPEHYVHLSVSLRRGNTDKKGEECLDHPGSEVIIN